MITDLHRNLWVQSRYREAVELFHRERKSEDNAHRDLVELSKACASVAFAVNVGSIIGNKETTAKEFMKYCREHIGGEIQRAILETEEVELLPC